MAVAEASDGGWVVSWYARILCNNLSRCKDYHAGLGSIMEYQFLVGSRAR